LVVEKVSGAGIQETGNDEYMDGLVENSADWRHDESAKDGGTEEASSGDSVMETCVTAQVADELKMMMMRVACKALDSSAIAEPRP